MLGMRPKSDVAGSETSGGAEMRAKAGDHLVAESGCSGLILDVLGADGQPPYVVRWLRSEHITMVVPDQYARIVPANRISHSDRDQSAD
jgi:hypothetical protein